jgi:Zn-dependent peptidase ImmA (M78 family)
VSRDTGLSFEWEWLSAAEVKASELRATWAHLRISAGADCVTLVEDKESGSSRRSIFTSLYPLAEWVAYNWWFLRADTRPATALSRLPARYDALWSGYGEKYRARHGLRGVGDGFLWPDLFIMAEGETARIIWNADKAIPEGRPVRFLTSGNISVDAGMLMQQLANFVESVIDRLCEQGVSDTPLATEWANIQSADLDETDFCLAAARLGLDPYSDALKYSDDILRTSEQLSDSDLLGDFLDVVDPDKIAATLSWVSATKDEIDALTSRPSGEVAELRSSARPSPEWNGLRPWELGWAQARLVRNSMNLDQDRAFDIERLVTDVTRPTNSLGIHALGQLKEGGSPLLVVSRRQPDASKRFVLARALWHVLWRDSPTFLVTSAYTDRQKTERAFAAEILAPAQGIASRIVDDGVHSGLEDSALDELAGHFRVSTLLVQHQIENQLVPTW